MKAREIGSDEFAHLAHLNFLEARDYARAEHMNYEEIIHVTFLLGQAEFALGNFAEATKMIKRLQS